MNRKNRLMLNLNFGRFYLSGTFLVLAFLLTNCGKPKPLSKKEKNFFSQLEKECQCEITREYDEEATSDFRNGRGWYNIFLTYKGKKYIDSLERPSRKIAHELHESVLTDVEYPYNKITVTHILDNGYKSDTIAEYDNNYNNHLRFLPF